MFPAVLCCLGLHKGEEGEVREGEWKPPKVRTLGSDSSPATSEQPPWASHCVCASVSPPQNGNSKSCLRHGVVYGIREMAPLNVLDAVYRGFQQWLVAVTTRCRTYCETVWFFTTSHPGVSSLQGQGEEKATSPC